MANTAHDVLAVAASQLDYTAAGDPEAGTRYGRWYAKTHGSYFGQSGVAWCAMFVSWCFAQAGATCPGLPNAACEYVRQQAKKAGALRANVRDAKPGDVILFDWGDGGWADHVGIVEANHGGYVSTIEGNVAGGVHRRNRAWGTVVDIVVPSYGMGGESDMTQEEHDMLAQIAATTAVGGNCSWNYDWEGTAPGGNVYNCLRYTHAMVQELSAQVAALSAAMETLAESKGVDADAVTKAVTKAVAAKLDGLTLQFKAEG